MALNSQEKRGPGRSGRLSADQAAELPERLLDAAQALFCEAGYADTSMEKIARKAGASTKTIYGRYANKDEILQAVVRRLIDRTLANVDMLTRIEPGQAELRAFLVNMCRLVGERLGSQEGAGLNRLALSEAYRSPVLQEFFESSVGRGRGIIKAQLDYWKAAGRLPLLGDSAAAAMIFLSMATDLPRMRAVMGMALTPAEVCDYVEGAVDIFLRGLAYEAPASAA